jgi:4-amino-4-deoxy-L-arabinose transferase-like glycosyltransferase
VTAHGAGLSQESATSASSSWRGPFRLGRGWSPLLWLFLPLAFFSAMILFYSFRFVFEFDPDEGINAMKALLTLRGFHLYSEIWSDQPPIFTLLLAGWFRLLGLKVVAGRLLVLIFSTVLAAAVVYHLRRSWGALAAVCGFLFLILLPQYARLSVSIMIGLPSIALGFLSILFLTLWHSKRSPIWLSLSSICLGLAIFTKGFLVILLPLIGAGLAVTLWRSPSRRFRWTSLAAWVIPLAGLAVWVLFFVVGPQNLGQLAEVHVAAQNNPAFQPTVILPTIHAYLRHSVPLLVLAALGVYQTVRARTWIGLYLAGWVVLAYLGLLFNRPTWPHHELLITVPAAVLAGIGAAAALRELWHRLRHGSSPGLPLAVALLGLAALGALLVTRLPAVLDEFDLRLPNLTPYPADGLSERQIVALMADHADETQWVYAENPMFPFQAGLAVPPPLAVLSSKRLATGTLTDDQILKVLEEFKPEIVMQSRFFLPAAEEYMRLRNFTRIDETPKYRLYLRKDSS